MINAQYDDEGYIETLNCEMPYLLNKETKERLKYQVLIMVKAITQSC